jgi:hypothetical protein
LTSNAVGSKYLVQVREFKGTNLPDFELLGIHTHEGSFTFAQNRLPEVTHIRALLNVNMKGTFGPVENITIKSEHFIAKSSWTLPISSNIEY